MSAAVIMYDGYVSRWSPDTRGRLEQAAFELFRDHGYEKTTVADIAKRAGLTERTFFRHYTDKREVLFGGAATLQSELLRAVGDLPPELPTFAAVRAAVEALCAFMHGRREHACERQRVVDTHADLQERELIKRATLTAALAEALKKRGTPNLTASLVADMGIGVFYVAFARWLEDAADRELVEIVREGFDQLKSVASGA
jgi:AcrR family transcriptional regulator